MDKVPVSDLCDELKLQPSLLYQWQRQLFSRGGAAFETSTKPSREKEGIAAEQFDVFEVTQVTRGTPLGSGEGQRALRCGDFCVIQSWTSGASARIASRRGP